MEVVNEIYPSDPAQIARLMEPGPDGPIVMVNLLKFRDRARYADGRDTNLTGKEAYALYATSVSDYIREFGGRVLFAGDVTHLSIGKAEALWDEVALAEYPNRAAMIRMSASPGFREFSIHREAGLEGQLNIETVYQPGIASVIAATTGDAP